MSTVFSQARMDDSKRAHLAAQAQFYPVLFPRRALKFEDVTKTVQDLEYAIDVQVAVDLPQLRAPLRFSVQERWRFDLAAKSFGDVTVTEWNLDTDRPSDLHKLGAHLFVYGFYDKEEDIIAAAAAIEVARMLRALSLRKLDFTRRSRGDQSFIAVSLRDLESIGAVILKTSVLTMPWVRFDDQFPIHRKVDGLSDAAYRLHTSAIFWCARNLTDGFVSEEDLDGVTARVRTPARFASECVKRDIWHQARTPCASEKCPGPVDKDGWIIHDYWEYQPSKEQVIRDRESSARRQSNWRKKRNGSSNGVTNGVDNTTPPRPEGSGTGDARPERPAARASPPGSPAGRSPGEALAAAIPNGHRPSTAEGHARGAAAAWQAIGKAPP